jgi:hypothetical protein
LPVIATIREAYEFTFTHLGAIIGLIWLPMVLVTVGDFFVTRYVAVQTAAGFPNNAGLAQLMFLPMQILLYAVMFVPVTELALGQRQGGAMIHFGFGKPEWRMFRAFLGLMILLLMAGVAMAGILGGTPGAAAPMGQGVAQSVLLIMTGALLYILIRLASLLPPLVLTDDKPLLQTSWTLTAGNFWQLLGVGLAIFVPVLFLMAAATAMALSGSFDPATMPTMSSVNQAVAANLPMVMGVEFFFAPVLIGLTVGASVFSFKALTRTDLSV